MPPYTKVTSKAQSRKLFALAAEGKISKAEARGKTRAANWDRLPQHHRQSMKSLSNFRR